MSKPPSSPAVSFKLSLSNRTSVGSLADSVRASIGRGADSVVVTVRGAKSVMVALMESLSDHAVDVSAVLTIRGDKPGR